MVTHAKKARINKKLDNAIQKMVSDTQDGKLIRSETVMALKLAVQWEAVKAKLKGDDEYGTALAELGGEGDPQQQPGEDYRDA